MSSARTDIRDIVEESRQDKKEEGNGKPEEGTTAAEGGGKGSSAGSPKTPAEDNVASGDGSTKRLVPKPQRNMESVLSFVSQLTATSAQQPNGTLEELLEELGYGKHTGSDDDSEDSFSSSSFSFNFQQESFAAAAASGGPSAASLLSSAGGFLKNALSKGGKNNLTRFSSTLAHRCWVENNRELFSHSSGGQGEGAAAFHSKKEQRERALENEQTVVPWRGDAAVMFIDLSGYSRIASLLTRQGGAHALSEAVNAYFEAILGVVIGRFGGDVLTYAGDAVVVCWPCTEGRTAQHSTLLACACALDVQRKCGMSPVRGTDLFFRLHIGITFGEIESQVLLCRSSRTMQGAYHFVSGPPLSQTALVVDAAKIGETCITKEVAAHVAEYLQAEKVTNSPEEATGSTGSTSNDQKTTTTKSETNGKPETTTNTTKTKTEGTEDSAEGNEACVKLLGLDDDYEEKLMRISSTGVAVQRSPWIDSHLVPPTIAAKIRQGFKPAHIAEMRFLCVLFIRKQLATVHTEEWFGEVQQVLDECRCPIVQLIHDDKGTHIIAAVNLYSSERSPALGGILAARKLVERDTGSALGVACGEVFCGITGSDEACRWDITGPAVVRACRLMQHAVTSGEPAVLDSSVYEATDDVSQLVELPDKLTLKGSLSPVQAFALSEASVTVTSGILSGAWGSAGYLQQERNKLKDEFLLKGYQRGASLVSGPVGCGKKTLITIAVEQCRIFSFMCHFTSKDPPHLCVLSSLFEWFARHADPGIEKLAVHAGAQLVKGKFTQALHLAHQLVDELIRIGVRFCFVVAYAHFLDAASLRFLKAIVSGDRTQGDGQFLVVMTAYSLYGGRSPSDIAADLHRSLSDNQRRSDTGSSGSGSGGTQKKKNDGDEPSSSPPPTQTAVLHLRLSYANTSEQFAEGVRGYTYFILRPQLAQVLFEAMGGCMSLVLPWFQHMDEKDPESGVRLYDKYLPSGADSTIFLSPEGEDYFLREINWPVVAPDACSRLTELYDALPARLQLVLRIIASLATTTGAANRHHVHGVAHKLNSKLTEERVMGDIEMLQRLDILRAVDQDGGEVAIAVPAMVDVVVSLLTPDQHRILRRHAFFLTYEFYEGPAKKEFESEAQQYLPVFTSFCAKLARAAQQREYYIRLLRESWDWTLKTTDPKGKNSDVRQRMEERLATEHRRYPDWCTASIFDDFSVKPLLSQFKRIDEDELARCRAAHPLLYFAKDYMPPMALGAISGELQKICWSAVNAWLDHVKRKEDVLIPEEARQFLKVNIDSYMNTIELLEKHVPQETVTRNFPSPHLPQKGECKAYDSFPEKLSIAEEKELLLKVLAIPKDAKEGEYKTALFRAYHFRVILPRRDRVVAMVTKITEVCPEMDSCLCMVESRNDAVKRAFVRFCRPSPLPPRTIHDALLDLGTAGWVSRYYNINLQAIRDQVLRRRTSDVMDFKSMLLSLKLFGEEITAAVRPV